MGTGVKEYDNLTECLVPALQASADHLTAQAGDLPGESR
jgi:hypothetical protein